MFSKFVSLILSFLLFLNLIFPVFADDSEKLTRYPDYAKMYVGEDKFEGFNRKMLNLNRKLNKFVARPVHILWALIMPQYGMDRIQSAYNNIYCPGVPCVDADNLKLVTQKILSKLEDKYECKFDEKIIIGTSFGVFSSLFVAEKESKNNTLCITKFIAISPPVELVYAVEQLDKNSEDFDNNSPDVKHKTAITAAKILQITKLKETCLFTFFL